LDTKSKKYKPFNRGAYNVMFAICVFSFLAFLSGIIGWAGIIDMYGGSAWGPWKTIFPEYFSGSYYGYYDASSYAGIRFELIGCVVLMVAGGLLALGSFIYLCAAAGERNEEGKIILKGIDTWFTEFQLLAVSFLFMFCGSFFMRFGYAFVTSGVLRGNWYGTDGILSAALAAAFGLVGGFLGLWFIMAMVRKIKAGVFLRNSLIATLTMYLYKILFKSGSTMQKVVLVSLAICLLSATVFLAPVVFVVLLVFAPKFVKKYDEIRRGIDEVKSGNLDYKIPVDGTSNGELDEIARDINQISEASRLAVQNEIKNQRMKTELISNVSHDLKTPLTSMVTYIDLLKTEGLGSESAPEYLDVLDKKTRRLCQLTNDLFEAAKAASGAMPVHLEKVEMVSLINQGLGELDQRIEESGLEFIINKKNEKYYVWADGQLMWRVIENILNNVLKYAQPETRVYIDLKEQSGVPGQEPSMVIMEVKNISRQALNIDPDELMERFKRGDESRSTEGSGLGLAIANDLVKLQKGLFEVKIDGDLFKSIVVLNRYKEQPQEPKIKDELKKEAKLEANDTTRIEPKNETQIESKVESKVEPEAETEVETKVEPKIETMGDNNKAPKTDPMVKSADGITE